MKNILKQKIEAACKIIQNKGCRHTKLMCVTSPFYDKCYTKPNRPLAVVLKAAGPIVIVRDFLKEIL